MNVTKWNKMKIFEHTKAHLCGDESILSPLLEFSCKLDEFGEFCFHLICDENFMLQKNIQRDDLLMLSEHKFNEIIKKSSSE
jgi:hypothetical protein